MKVYAIPGMGADARVFNKIKLPNDYELVTLEWIAPLPKETLADYSLRILSTINTNEPFALMGLSMGGMIACSFANHYPPQFIILISSVGSYQDIPSYYQWLGKLGLHQLIPMNLLKYLSKLKRKLLKEAKEDQELLLDMIRSSDTGFLRWSITAILHWKEPPPTTRIYHIHGKQDWLLPYRLIKKKPILIPGGHAMILSSHLQLQEQLDHIFQKEQNTDV